MKILIAEDDPGILMTLQIMLEDRGHKVVTAADGEAGLNAYRLEASQDSENSLSGGIQKTGSSNHPFDAVVLDHRMPYKDGMEVAKEIRNLNPSQRIVIASAYTSNILQDCAASLDLTNVEYLQKPFELEFFVDMLEDNPTPTAIKVQT